MASCQNVSFLLFELFLNLAISSRSFGPLAGRAHIVAGGYSRNCCSPELLLPAPNKVGSQSRRAYQLVYL